MTVDLSATKCIVAKWHILQQKCLNKWLGTWFYNFQCPLPILSPQTSKFHLLNHSHCCHLANTLKHTWNQQIVKISKPRIAIVSILHGYSRQRLIIGYFSAIAGLLVYIQKLDVCSVVNSLIVCVLFWTFSMVSFHIDPPLIHSTWSRDRTISA